MPSTTGIKREPPNKFVKEINKGRGSRAPSPLHKAKTTEMGEGWKTRPPLLSGLRDRLSKGFKWVFGLKGKKYAQSERSRSQAEQTSTKSRSVPESPRQSESQKSEGDRSLEEQISFRKVPENAPETKSKQRNLISAIRSSSLTQSAEGGDTSEEGTSAFQPNPQPAKKESLINTPQAVQRRTVAIGEGSQYSEKVGQHLHLAVDSVDPEKLESNRSYRTVTALVGGTIDDVDPPSTVKLVTSGHLDKFIRELGALVSPQTAFETKVEWDFSVQEETRQVTATYRLQPKEGGRGGPSLEGGIEFSIDDGDWQLLDPCLIGPAVLPALTKAKDDPNAKSDVLVTSSSSSDDDSASDSEETAASSSDDNPNPALPTQAKPAVTSPSLLEAKKFTSTKDRRPTNSKEREARVKQAKEGVDNRVRTRHEVQRDKRFDAQFEKDDQERMADDVAYKSNPAGWANVTVPVVAATPTKINKVAQIVTKTLAAAARSAGEMTGVVPTKEQFWRLPPELADNLTDIEILIVWREIDQASKGNHDAMERLKIVAQHALRSSAANADPVMYFKGYAEGRSHKTEPDLCNALIRRITLLDGGRNAVDSYGSVRNGRLSFEDVLAMARNLPNKEEKILMVRFIQAARRGYEAGMS